MTESDKANLQTALEVGGFSLLMVEVEKHVDLMKKSIENRVSYERVSAQAWTILLVACILCGLAALTGWAQVLNVGVQYNDLQSACTTKAQAMRVMLLENHIDPDTGKRFDAR